MSSSSSIAAYFSASVISIIGSASGVSYSKILPSSSDSTSFILAPVKKVFAFLLDLVGLSGS